MKKFKTQFLLFILLPLALFSQEEQQFIIKNYPLNMLVIYEFNLAAEKIINEKSSFEILLGTSIRDHIIYYDFIDVNYLWKYDWNIDGYHLSRNVLSRISYRYYPGESNRAPYNLFIGPKLLLKYSNVNDVYYVDTYDQVYKAYIDFKKILLAPSIIIGKQKNVGSNGFIVGWYVGIGARFAFYEKITKESWYIIDYMDPMIIEYSNKIREKNYLDIRPGIYFGISFGYALKKKS